MPEELIVNEGIAMDKLDAVYSFRLPECTKEQIEKLSPETKKKLNVQLLMVTARVLHESNFDPGSYLSTRE